MKRAQTYEITNCFSELLRIPLRIPHDVSYVYMILTVYNVKYTSSLISDKMKNKQEILHWRKNSKIHSEISKWVK